MKKKITALLLTAAMMLGLMTVSASAANQTFNDVPTTHWAYSYIQSAAADGVMNGVGDGNFAPGKTLTRAEFIVILMRAFYPDEVAAKEIELKDKGYDVQWYTPHCFVVYEKDLYDGITDALKYRNAICKIKYPKSKIYETSQPLSENVSANISRIDMAAMAGKIMLDKGIKEISDSDMNAVLASIPDANEVAEDQKTMMALVYSYKIITGIDAAGTFNPNGTVDRAVAATIYCRLRDCIRNGSEVSTTPTPDVTETPEATPSVTPDPVTPPADVKKAPYATTEDNIIGTFSDEDVVISLKTHIAPVDYWGNHPEIHDIVSQDYYNAQVFTMLNREWLYKNGVTAPNRTTFPKNFNAPCYDKNGILAPIDAEAAVSLGGYGYPIGSNLYIPNIDDRTTTEYLLVNYTKPTEMHNGAFAPIFAKFTNGMSDKDKIVIMVEALCERMTYNDDSAEVANLPGALTSGYWDSTAPLMKGICDDYAIMFREICLKAGIPCILESGHNHAWNLVYADGTWYAVDPSAIDLNYDKDFPLDDQGITVLMGLDGWVANDSTPTTMLIVEALYKDVYGS